MESTLTFDEMLKHLPMRRLQAIADYPSDPLRFIPPTNRSWENIYPIAANQR